MERTQRIKIWPILPGFIVLFFAMNCGGPPALVKPAPKEVAWHLERFPFMDDWGKVFTFESEFDWPAGYSRPDSASLTHYAFWSSNFPLWHKDQGVSSVRYGRVFNQEEICRSIHFKWRTSSFTDMLIPIQILAEYYLWLERARELTVLPTAGEPMVYQKWLESKVSYNAGRALRFLPDAEREDTRKEYGTFLSLCATNLTYSTLIKNCRPVDSDKVLPGDLFIASNENGVKGKAYVVVCMLKNRKNEKLYAVGTGCEKTCDFHIPLVNELRSDPWLTAGRVLELDPEFPNRGFYRLIYSDLSNLK